MKENVGKKDRLIRSIAAPALIGVGYSVLKGNKGHGAGLCVMMLGTLIAESALTKVCPANALLGIDTRKKKGPLEKIQKILE